MDREHRPGEDAAGRRDPLRYRHFAGNDADAGASMLDVLKYWRKTGIGGDKILAFTQLQSRSVIQVRDSVSLFGACYIGVSLPDFAIAPGADVLTTPWVLPRRDLSATPPRIPTTATAFRRSGTTNKICTL